MIVGDNGSRGSGGDGGGGWRGRHRASGSGDVVMICGGGGRCAGVRFDFGHGASAGRDVGGGWLGRCYAGGSGCLLWLCCGCGWFVLFAMIVFVVIIVLFNLEVC